LLHGFDAQPIGKNQVCVTKSSLKELHFFTIQDTQRLSKRIVQHSRKAKPCSKTEHQTLATKFP